jgi:hypothetical protein
MWGGGGHYLGTYTGLSSFHEWRLLITAPVRSTTSPIPHNQHHKNAPSLCATMQKLLNDVIWIAVRLLELDTCSYHHILFDFNSDGSATPRLGQVGPPITISQNRLQAGIQVPFKSITKLHRTLGHCCGRQLLNTTTDSKEVGHKIST